MDPLEIPREAVEVLALGGGNLLAWIAHSEQIWFPMTASLINYVAPAYGLPDLRGPLAFMTLMYIGLRLGDLLEERNELEA